MTTFKEIRGTTIEVVSTDPTNPEIGQIWYNSSSGTLKGYVALTAGWTAGGNINTTRYIAGGAGTQTAALMFGGYDGGTSILGSTESYNGAVWTSVNSMNSARHSPGGAGTQTASAPHPR